MGNFPLPKHGCSAMVTTFAEDLPLERIKLNTRVTKVAKEEEGVLVHSINQEGETQVYLSQKVICTLPLGLLKEKVVKFDPPLPSAHQHSIDSLGFRMMDKVFLAFEQPFWKEDVQRIKIATLQSHGFSHFVNLSTSNSFILCGFVFSEFWRKEQKQSGEQIANLAVNALKSAFPNSEMKLKEFHVTDWAANPFARGSWSYFTAPSTMETNLNTA